MLPSLSLIKRRLLFPLLRFSARARDRSEAIATRLSISRSIRVFPSPISIGGDSGNRARSSSPRNRSPKGRHHRRNRLSGKLIVIDDGSTPRWHARGIPGETLDPLVLSLLLRRSDASDISAADSVFHFVINASQSRCCHFNIYRGTALPARNDQKFPKFMALVPIQFYMYRRDLVSISLFVLIISIFLPVSNIACWGRPSSCKAAWFRSEKSYDFMKSCAMARTHPRSILFLMAPVENGIQLFPLFMYL